MRPNQDRRRVHLWVSRRADAIRAHAERNGATVSDTYRAALAIGWQQLTQHTHRYVCDCGQTRG